MKGCLLSILGAGLLIFGYIIWDVGFRENWYLRRFDRFLERNDFEKAESISKKLFCRNELPQRIFDRKVSYLISLDDENSDDRLVFLMKEYSILEAPFVGVTDNSRTVKQNETYNKAIAEYNSKCSEILSMAIVRNNLHLAHSIVQLYKPLVSRKTYKEHLILSDELSFEFDDSPKIEAEKRLNDAIKKGKFKE